LSLVRRGDIWHFDFTVDGYRHRGSTGLRDKKAAFRFEDRERERASLGSTHRQSYALQDVTTKWYAAKVAGRKSETTTAHRVKIMLRHLGPLTPITGIDTPHIAEAIQARRMEPTRMTARSDTPKPVSNTTINRDLIDGTLRPIMHFARKTLKLPVRDIDWQELRLPEPVARDRSFSSVELAAFRNGLPSWHRPLFDFIARYGVRLSEAFFTLDAFDVERGEITLRRRKRGGDHVIPLLEEDRRALAAMAGRAKAANLTTLWFREDKRGKLIPTKARGYQSACSAALRAAKLVDARPVHDLRHHAASEALRASGNLVTVQGLLGHADIKSTTRYAHVKKTDILAALRHASGTIEPGPEEKKNEDKAVSEG
jgi:integrase